MITKLIGKQQKHDKQIYKNFKNKKKFKSLLRTSFAERQITEPSNILLPLIFLTGTYPEYSEEDYLNAVTANLILNIGPEPVNTPLHQTWKHKHRVLLQTTLDGAALKLFSVLPMDINSKFTDKTENNSLNSNFINTQETLKGSGNLTQQEIQTPSHFNRQKNR